MLRCALSLVISMAAVASTDVYYGKTDGAKKPAEIVAQDIFNEISEYKKIKEKGLTKDDAEYWVLLNHANEKFNKAVKKIVDEGKYDVVVEKGKHKFSATPSDVTKKVIDALK